MEKPASDIRSRPAAKSKSRPAIKFLYIFTVTITAACGLIMEIVAGRMLAPYLGMSLYTWTAIIAVVLAGFSAGHWVGGLIAERPDEKAEASLGWVLMLAGLSSALSLVLLRVVSGPLIALGLSPVPTIIALTSALFFAPSFFVGIPSPVLTKLAIQDDLTRTGRTLGTMYAAGALGSIFGTLLAGYVFISWLGVAGTVLSVTAAYICLSAIFFIRNTRRIGVAALWPFVAGVLVLGGVSFAGRNVLAFRTNCTTESNYYCIRIVDISQNVGTPAKVMILDHLGHGMNLKREPDSFLSSYVELTDILATNHVTGSADFSAFFIGGGAFTLPRAWQQKYKKARITVAEIDPEVTALAVKKMWFTPGPNVTIRHADARRVLGQSTSKYSVIVGDAFHVEKQGNVSVEPGLSSADYDALVAAWPHTHLWPETNMFFGGVHAAALLEDRSFEAAGDPRRGGIVRRVW